MYFLLVGSSVVLMFGSDPLWFLYYIGESGILQHDCLLGVSRSLCGIKQGAGLLGVDLVLWQQS